MMISAFAIATAALMLSATLTTAQPTVFMPEGSSDTVRMVKWLRFRASTGLSNLR